MDTASDVAQRFAKLRTYRSGDRRAPHKPLLLLFAIGQLQRGHESLAFDDVDRALEPLLSAYAPPVKSRHQPELPYWHLQTDDLWVADTVANGIALEPTIHKLFDVGAWSLTDDRRIIVSANLTGTDTTIERIRSRHGHPLTEPLPGEPQVSAEFIQWHRETDLGGVFRAPGLPL